MIVPLFPLNGAFLFPGAILPLHIFEPRYREMIDDLMDAAGRLVVAAVREGEDGEAPAVYPVAGLGEISGHERFPDGRYVIALFGLGRVRLEEVPSERAYRQVKVEELEEVPIPPESEPAIRLELMAAATERAPKPLDIPEAMPTDRLIDLLLMQLQLPPAVMARHFAVPDVLERARGALAEHGRRAPRE